MRILTRLNAKIHYDDTKRPTRKYRVIKEYPRYYLCECLHNGKALYRECFLKIYADGVVEIPVEKESNPRMGWHM